MSSRSRTIPAARPVARRPVWRWLRLGLRAPQLWPLWIVAGYVGAVLWVCYFALELR